MKFSDELAELWDLKQSEMTDRNYKDIYNEGFLDGIKFAENHVRRIESLSGGALEMLKQSIKRLFLRG